MHSEFPSPSGAHGGGRGFIKFALVSRGRKDPALSQWSLPFRWVEISVLKVNLVLEKVKDTKTAARTFPVSVQPVSVVVVVER